MSKPNEFNFNLDDLAVISEPAAILAWLAGAIATDIAKKDFAAVDKSFKETLRTMTDRFDDEAAQAMEAWLKFANEMIKLCKFFIVVNEMYGGYPYIKK